MKYDLRNVANDNRDILINYKIETVTKDNKNNSLEEYNRLVNYIHHNVAKNLDNSKYIVVNGKIVGCVVVYDHLDGVLLDELYLEEDYRNKKIGSSILKNILKDNKIVYLWVYKNNTIAYNLYLKNNFKVTLETESRYFMKYMCD